MKEETNFVRIGKIVARNKFLFYFLNLTWGLISVIVGFIIVIFLRMFKAVKETVTYYNKKFYILKKEGTYAFSIGLTIVMADIKFGPNSDDEDDVIVIDIDSLHPHSIKAMQCNRLREHEIGHCIQNAILGPFTIFLVYIPSVIRFWNMQHKLKNGVISVENYNDIYESVWFEKSATVLGGYF